MRTETTGTEAALPIPALAQKLRAVPSERQSRTVGQSSLPDQPNLVQLVRWQPPPPWSPKPPLTSWLFLLSIKQPRLRRLSASVGTLGASILQRGAPT